MTSSDKEVQAKLPFFAMILGSYKSLIDNFRSFTFIALPYCFILTFLSFIMGFAQVCYFDDFFPYCSSSNILYIAYQLIKLILISMFMILYFQTSYLATPKKLLVWNKTLAKTVSFNIFSLFLCLCPFISLKLLIERVPNPNWKIEITYFGFVFLGFLVPFFLMRIYAALAFIISEQKIPSVSSLLKRTSGNTIKITGGFFLIILFLSLSMVSVINHYQYNSNNWIDAFCLEFIISFVSLIFTSLLCAISKIEKQYLYEEYNNAK